MSFNPVTRLIDEPLYIVTAAADDERSGCLIGFATQRSIHPPRFLTCLSVVNHTFQVARRASVLGVHVLTADQRALAEHFGCLTGDEEDKFAGVARQFCPHGAPILRDATASFEGLVLERLPFGDHVGHVLEPLDAAGDPQAVRERQIRLRDAAGIRPGHPADEVLER